MTPVQSKYFHVSTTNVAGKWKSVNLSTLAKKLTPAQATELMPVLRNSLIFIAKKRVKELKDLKVPPIIMQHDNRILRNLKRGKHPDLNPLKRVVRLAV